MHLQIFQHRWQLSIICWLYHARLQLMILSAFQRWWFLWSLFNTTFVFFLPLPVCPDWGKPNRRQRRIRHNHRILDCVIQLSELITVLLNDFMQATPSKCCYAPRPVLQNSGIFFEVIFEFIIIQMITISYLNNCIHSIHAIKRSIANPKSYLCASKTMLIHEWYS